MTESEKISVSSPSPLLSVRGNLVGLGSWLPEHLDRWMEAIHDPELNIYSDGTFAMPSREREAGIFDSTAQNRANFAIYVLENMKFIGSCGLFGIDQRPQTGSIGISIIDKAYWGKGYGSETVKLVADYGFRFMNLHNIWLDTNSFNGRAIRAYEKAGFKLVGRRREAQVLAGKRYDLVYMDCLRTEFESPRPGWFELQS